MHIGSMVLGHHPSQARWSGKRGSDKYLSPGRVAALSFERDYPAKILYLKANSELHIALSL